MEALTRIHRNEGLDCSHLVTFNLDEYIGLPHDHPQSYHHYMFQNFFDHININRESIHIPDGSVREDYEAYCEEYERSIRDASGIDLQVLGLGVDGHIGFNEPASSLGSRTRLKTLTKQTWEDNQRFFASDQETPQVAITMGIGTILEARRILLLASGAHKAVAVAKAIEGPVTSSVTASALQLHPDVTAILDEEASSELVNKEYYRRVIEMTTKMTPGRLS